MNDFNIQKILFTGSTGFLGKYIVKNLLKQGHELFLVLRTPFKFKKDNLIRALTADNSKAKDRITIVEGDITEEKIFANNEDFEKIAEEVTEIYHCAGMYNVNLFDDEEIMTDTNINGTTNILNISRKIKNLKKLNYISAASISGKARGVFFEDELDKSQEFNNFYEQSKFIAEKMVRSAKKDIPTTIFRPTNIIGNSITGEAERKDGIYYLIDLINQEKEFLKKIPLIRNIHPLFPASSTSYINLVPVDYVGKASRDIT